MISCFVFQTLIEKAERLLEQRQNGNYDYYVSNNTYDFLFRLLDDSNRKG